MPNYASIGSRIAAIIIDSIILFVVFAIIAVPLGISATMFSTMGNPAGFTPNFGYIGTLVFLNFVLWILYFTYFEAKSGQTLGKKALGIKVVKETGKKITNADAFVRTILRLIDSIGFYILGLIVIMVSQKKQRIGDLAAHTIVVKA
jgi:uncharacterized RDD family membrane protein YckC